ncbi:hypothetical protein AMR72_01040 [Flavobacterium psychrophilum]|nr:hypothetical protein AMR72_01040 [Flavobacterium psychrophilum]AOE51228.1 hypothetical protein ALW18_01040 [Flavobacterium psychrophilum]
MKNIYTALIALITSFTFAQETISFESAEGYQLGTLNAQNGWEITEGSDGFLLNQVVSSEKASQGSYSFKNSYEPDFDFQWLPIFGASKTFAEPADYTEFTISYDIMVTDTLGSDFEFTLFAIDENDEYAPVAGVGIENRGMVYLIKDVNYGIEYADSEWLPNEWINVRIEVTATEIKYYINNVLEQTLSNFTKLNIVGFNMLHNNYGYDAYYDNIVVSDGTLSDENFKDSSLLVYPNPTVNTLSVAMSGNTEISGIEIYNLTGQNVLQTKQTQNIDISQLASGSYFLKATDTNGASFTKKILKN